MYAESDGGRPGQVNRADGLADVVQILGDPACTFPGCASSQRSFVSTGSLHFVNRKSYTSTLPKVPIRLATPTRSPSTA